MTFRKYDKIPRLGTSETNGILEGTVFLFPKLDGTNASMWWDRVSHSVAFGSRNRPLSADQDNAGFMNWGLTQDVYSNFMVATSGRFRLYGEWLVPHTIKEYEDDAWRKFYIYDVWDEVEQRYLSYNEYAPLLDDHGIPNVLPCIVLTNPTMEDIEASMKILLTCLMKEGEEGEGITIKRYGFVNRYGNPVYAKYIRDKFMDKKKRVVTDNPVETELAERCVSRDLVVKTVAKVLTLKGDEEWDRGKHIPILLEIVMHDIFEEKLYGAVKKMKWPSVHFGKFKGAVVQQIKKEGKEYF